MKTLRIFIALVCLLGSLACAAWAAKEDIYSSTTPKNKIVEAIRNCIDKGITGIEEICGTFWQKIRAPAANVATPPLAQPGSYSLTPPLNQPKDESLRDFLRDTRETGKED